MTGEIDLDAFEFGPTIDAREPEPAIKGSVPRLRVPRMTPDPEAAPAKPVPEPQPVSTEKPDPVSLIRALVFVSRTGGEGHIVTVHQTDKGPGVLCNCPATLSLDRRPQGCWAMQAARSILGLPAPVATEPT